MQQGELPGEQDGRAGVDLPERVQSLRRHVQDRAVVTALGVIADEDVEASGERPRRLDHRGDRGRVSEVGAQVAERGIGRECGRELAADGLEVVSAPRQREVVRPEVVEQDAGAEPRELGRDGEADAATTRDARDEGGLAVEGKGCR